MEVKEVGTVKFKVDSCARGSRFRFYLFERSR